MTKREEREHIFLMFHGHCAYCGDILQENWHIDHKEPVRRYKKFDIIKSKYINTMDYPERDILENKFPACPSCNINKHSMNIEEFRRFISRFIRGLNDRSIPYKIAKRYGLLVETGAKVEFYFEKVKKNLTNAG